MKYFVILLILIGFSGIAYAVEDIEPQLNTRLNELLQEEISIQTKILELKSLMEESSESSIQIQIISLESRLNTIYSELDVIQAQYKEMYAMSKEEGERITPHLEDLQAKQLDLREQGIPVVSIGLGGRVHGIVIGLDGTIANSSASVDEFTQMLSKHISNDIPWSVHTEESIAYQTDPCTSRQNCDPVVGGAEIEVKNMAGCTFGYEATKAGVNGFVTAGHCADGQVGQGATVWGHSTRELSIVYGLTHGDIEKTIHLLQDPNYPINVFGSPYEQVSIGIEPEDILCKEGLLLLQKYDGSPACVTEQTKHKLIERGWTEKIIDMISSKHADVEKLLIENKINYIPDKLVITTGVTIRGDPACGAVVDTDSKVHWFGIDSISNPREMTLYDENPNQCVVNTISCFCNVQIELSALTLDELDYFTPQEQEKYANILIGYLYEENINRTPKFMIGKHNVNYTDPSAIGYCGKIWGTNTYGYFSGAIVNGEVKDYGIDKELPLLCAITDDAQYFGKVFGDLENEK